MKKIISLLSPYRGLKKEVYIIVASKTINAMGALIYPFLTLLLSRKIGLSSGQTGLYISLSGAMWIPSSLVGGKLSDKFGRKKILILFESLAVCGFLACSFLEPSMNMVWLIMVNSFCFGVAGPSHDAMTGDLTTAEEREGAYSLGYLGYNLGFALAQVFAGFLFENHLPLMFIVDGLTAAAAILMIALFVPETLPSVSDKPEDSKTDSEEADQSGKTLFRILYERPGLILFALIIFGYRFTYSSWSFLIPLHGEHRFPGGGAALYGMLGSFNAVIVVTMTPVLTFLFRGQTHIRKIFYAGILFTLGFGLLGFMDMRSAFFLSVFIFTMGEILEAISIMPYIMDHTPSSHRGRISSVLQLIMGTGFFISPPIMGSVLDATNFSLSWHIIAIVGFCSALCMGWLGLRKTKISCKKEKDMV